MCWKKNPFISKNQMKVEITNNVPGTESERDLIIPLAVQSKLCMVAVSFQAVVHCLAVREFGGTPGGPRCQFRLENDDVTLPVSLLHAHSIIS